jgi:hypothetical protein
MNNQIDVNKLHTTELGTERIRRNLVLTDDVDTVEWCKLKTAQADEIVRKGKNWYVVIGDVEITINAHNYTIITAHIQKLSSHKKEKE